MKRLSSANLRALVILLVFLTISIGYIARFDVGNLSTLGFGIISAICPLGFLETALADRSIILRALLSFVAVGALVILLGRVFCSWICPVPLIQRWFPGRKKQARELAEQIDSAVKAAEASVPPEADRQRELPGVDEPFEANRLSKMGEAGEVNEADGVGGAYEATSAAVLPVAVTPATTKGAAKNLKLDSRHLVLGGSLLSAAVFGFPVFCLICPVGLSFATLLVVFRLFGAGEMTWALLAFPLILILELVVFRKWCSKICPLGALISLLAGANRLLRPKVDDAKCLVTTKDIDCSICHRACTRENIDLRHPATSAGALSDCTKCRDCADACPTKAISFPLLSRKR
jgi:ferredoxin-type protein NapH